MSMFPKFVNKTIPPAKPAKSAKSVSSNLDLLEQEYFSLIRRFWSLDEDPDATTEEARQLVCWIDQIYWRLRQYGRRVPVRLPVERHQAQAQKGVAL
jgi:hypothetical protein